MSLIVAEKRHARLPHGVLHLERGRADGAGARHVRSYLLEDSVRLVAGLDELGNPSSAGAVEHQQTPARAIRPGFIRLSLCL